MRSKRLALFLSVAVMALSIGVVSTASAKSLTPLERLGKQLLFDKDLSAPRGQSCAACHAPNVGYTGPSSAINSAGAVYPGAVPWRFGNRKPPSAAYLGDSPVLHYDPVGAVWLGGAFWDGRATGWTLGDPLAEQAQGPFLNPLEQNLASAQVVCAKVARSEYAKLFKRVWGPNSLRPYADTQGTYERIARSIAAYERSSEVNPFDSRFDRFYDRAKRSGVDVKTIDASNWRSFRRLGLGDGELYGFALFNDTKKGKCSLCHTLAEGTAGYPLFTDFTYDNLGLPKNLANPFYLMPVRFNPAGSAWVDPGLGGFLKSAGYDASAYEAQMGKHKVPSLRNVGKRPGSRFVKAYGHNGYFKSLTAIVHFYNTRDVASWPAPEFAATVNHTELGDLKLTVADERALVSFMETLSDR